MDDTTDFFADASVPRARVALLLKHFSRLADEREPWRIVHPLAEVLLLLTCATIASCDDFDDIVAWGEHHLDFCEDVCAVPQWDPLRALAAHPGKPGRPADIRALFR